MVAPAPDNRNLPTPPAQELDNTSLAESLRARGFLHASLVAENPVVAGDLRLSDLFDLIEVKGNTVGQSRAIQEKYQNISKERFNEIVIEAFNRCASLLFQNNEPTFISVEERACMVRMFNDSVINPLIQEKPFRRLFFLDQEATTDFFLNLGLLSPIPSFIEGKDLLVGAGRLIKRFETSISPTEQEIFFRRTVERMLVCYNANEARERLEADFCRRKQPIEDQAFNQMFDLAASRVDGKLGNLGSYSLKDKISDMVQDAVHTFMNRNGADVMAVIDVLGHLVNTSDYYRTTYHTEARAEWIESLKDKHPITYLPVDGYTPLVMNWPLTPFCSECLQNRKAR